MPRGTINDREEPLQSARHRMKAMSSAPTTGSVLPAAAADW